MSNEQNNGIQISISAESVASISNTVLEWRKIQSYDLAKVLEMVERMGDKCLGVVTSIELARASRRDAVHVHTTEKAVKV